MRRVTVIVVVMLVLWMFWLGFFSLGSAEQNAQPAVSMQEATRIVETQYPNSRILEIELDTEDGQLVYQVELLTQEGQKKELHVNATTGRIDKVEND